MIVLCMYILLSNSTYTEWVDPLLFVWVLHVFSWSFSLNHVMVADNAWPYARSQTVNVGSTENTPEPLLECSLLWVGLVWHTQWTDIFPHSCPWQRQSFHFQSSIFHAPHCHCSSTSASSKRYSSSYSQSPLLHIPFSLPSPRWRLRIYPACFLWSKATWTKEIQNRTKFNPIQKH